MLTSVPTNFNYILTPLTITIHKSAMTLRLMEVLSCRFKFFGFLQFCNFCSLYNMYLLKYEKVK
jgi:hypothetical protein